MLYEYSTVENLLTAQGKTVLKDSATYATFATAAENIVAEKCGTLSTAPTWLTMPYVWILEYLASAKYSGITQELFTRLSTNYNSALKILSAHPPRRAEGTASIGEMEGLYTDEY
jgi:hypothetical protein